MLESIRQFSKRKIEKGSNVTPNSVLSMNGPLKFSAIDESCSGV